MIQPNFFRALLAVFSFVLSSEANAFAVFAVPVGTPVTTGQVIDLTVSNTAIPSAFGQGVALTWKQTSVNVAAAFTPNPAGPLTNGTTTWNQNAFAAMNDWNAVGANIRFNGIASGGNPCVTDGNVVAAFDATLCLGVPLFALGITRLVAVVDSPASIRITDADVAMIPPNTPAVNGAFINDAFDTLEVFPSFDFRRTVLHEFGHALGLAHPDTVFGVNPATQSTIMFSQVTVSRLAADDKNGALALYPAAAPSSSSSGEGGASSTLFMAIFLGALATIKLLHGHIHFRRAPANRRQPRG